MSFRKALFQLKFASKFCEVINIDFFSFFRTTTNLSTSSVNEAPETDDEEVVEDNRPLEKEEKENKGSELPATKRRKVDDDIDDLLSTCKSILHDNKDDDCSHFAN